MALGDLIANLYLNTKNFDTNISKSTKEIKDFKNRMESMNKSIGSGLGIITKFVPQLALLTGGIALAEKAYTDITNSSQAFSDKMAEIQTEIDAVSGSFMNAAINGGLSSFCDRLDDITEKAKDVARTMDNLTSSRAFSKMQSDYWKAKAVTAYNEGDIEKAKDYLRKSTISAEDFQKALMDSAVADVNLAISKSMSHLPRQVHTPELSEEDIMEIMGIPREELDRIGSELADRVKNLKELREKGVDEYGNALGIRYKIYSAPEKYKQDYKEALDSLNSYIDNSKVSWMAYIRYISNDGENALNGALQKFTEAERLMQEISEKDKTFTRSSETNKTSNTRSSGSDNTKAKFTSYKSIAEEGSISDLERQLKYWQTEFANAGDLAGQSFADNMVKSIEKRIASLKSPFKAMEKLSEKATANMSKPISLQKDIKKETDKVNDSIYTMSILTGSVADVFRSTGDSGAQAFATILQSTIPLISAIMTLALAEGEENAAKSSKNWIELIAAVAAVGATMITTFAVGKSKSKYANGGIVDGGIYSGDYNMVRVNSGEMILNGSQQANLFRLLNSGDFGNNSKSSNGQVEFKLRGTELIGLIKNSQNKTNKIL